ncbi:putative urease accessory protein UreF-like [Daldinia childiae]|uniref:putative urease accessory protein UreF-like n=1 Tax=Daldinia childiae TaxID=326645 RepID=UPI0014471115|nr:putative urease accessory protein UreF-like [Daldinia childiae]KAF3068957.1 putative urease accessory protein UreF-like [Daldinia childiae]
MDPTLNNESQEVLENEIADLELRLQRAKHRLAKSDTANINKPSLSYPSSQSAHHYLLLLSDSALPLGSFAFSSGLESYLAHTRRGPRPGGPSFSTSSASASPFSSFLPLSVSSYASTTLPFALAAHRDPSPDTIVGLDDALDAAIVCAVGRRASVQQGRALLAIWEKSIAAAADPHGTLVPYAEVLRAGTRMAGVEGGAGDEVLLPPPASAHLAPLFGAVAGLCGLSLRQTAYVFMLSHVKALVSAAVRAGLFGPYQAQRILAGGEVQGLLTEVIAREWDTVVEEAGQSVPVMDLWIGRHELLYSRIFNS